MDTEQLIHEVRDAAGRVAASREAVEEARRVLHRAALRALIAVEGDADRERALVRTLYWDTPELPVKTIEVVVGGPAQVRALAAPGPLLGHCDMCDVEVRATSRTHLATRTPRCKPCDRKPGPAPPTLPPDPWAEDAFPVEPPDWDDWQDADDVAWRDIPPYGLPCEDDRGVARHPA